VSEHAPPHASRASSTGSATDPQIAAAQAAVAQVLDTDRQSRAIAAILVADISAKVSGRLDTFATWLLAGFGGAVALLLTSHEVGTLVPPHTVRVCAILFGLAVIVTVAGKFIAIIVSGASEAAAFARTLILEHMKLKRELEQSESLDIKVIAEEIMRPMFRPARWIASRQIQKSLSGDHTAGARPLMRYGQIQGLLVLTEIGLFLAALWQIVANLPRL
jgi:hypothetical protein